MKNLLFLYAVVALISCVQNDSERIENHSNKWMSEFSPGLLGWSATEKIDCSQNELKLKLAKILTYKDFQVSPEDSLIVNYWVEHGFDFLDYSCININLNLYMITTNYESKNKSYIGIRAYYNRSKNKWIYAKKFSKKEGEKAHFALNSLLRLL